VFGTSLAACGGNGTPTDSGHPSDVSSHDTINGQDASPTPDGEGNDANMNTDSSSNDANTMDAGTNDAATGDDAAVRRDNGNQRDTGPHDDGGIMPLYGAPVDGI
jgi:hypothetical protein